MFWGRTQKRRRFSFPPRRRRLRSCCSWCVCLSLAGYFPSRGNNIPLGCAVLAAHYWLVLARGRCSRLGSLASPHTSHTSHSHTRCLTHRLPHTPPASRTAWRPHTPLAPAAPLSASAIRTLHIFLLYIFAPDLFLLFHYLVLIGFSSYTYFQLSHCIIDLIRIQL